MNNTIKEAPAYFGRGFTKQLAFYLGILCLVLLLRPPIAWINYIAIGYLILFWPIYFYIIWRVRSAYFDRKDK